MIFKNFFEKQFDLISEFIDEHADEIEENEEFNEKVFNRCRHWAKLASICSDDNITIGELISKLKSMDLQGIIKFGIKASKGFIVVVPDDVDYTPEYNEAVVDPEKDSLLTIARIIKEFDGEIEGIM
jgi:hypothetical protein